MLRKTAAAAGVIAFGLLVVGAGSAQAQEVPSARMAIAGDGCTNAPDNYGEANFRPACDAHDNCYSAGSPFSRLTCDQVLLYDLTQACDNTYSAINPLRYSCEGVAGGYYNAVRTFGRSHYEGSGDPS
ncbi:hypothetical protein GCM10010174_57660 [Kutzneria viridogrisea]|uniref:Phospholipase A2 n=2 Tax=Kutzneria TaxID=43356 RepID=A0ABR6BKJ0_9PSEU|nr:phospholipase A2 [Kutzneria albida]AHH95254.1 putative secreted protein [Kutzneria albida DSM 43870]MBA8927389.1 hypothetical protein [Kutzneria viridogrisea]